MIADTYREANLIPRRGRIVPGVQGFWGQTGKSHELLNHLTGPRVSNADKARAVSGQFNMPWGSSLEREKGELHLPTPER